MLRQAQGFRNPTLAFLIPVTEMFQAEVLSVSQKA